MTPNHFADLQERELRLRQARFSLADLQEFVAAAWPLIADVLFAETLARERQEMGAGTRGLKRPAAGAGPRQVTAGRVAPRPC